MTGAMMRAMVFRGTGRALALEERPIPEPGPGEVLVRVAACGVCRTDLHVVDGELARPRLPLVPGHEAVGRVAALGTGVERLRVGQRVGIPWLGWTCGACRWRTGEATRRRRRCSAPDSSATGRSAWRGTRRASASTASARRPTSSPRSRATRGA